MEKDENEVYTSSMSHPFQGGFVAWFFEGLAGITPDEKEPGYRLIHLEPQLIDGLNWVKCRFKSPMGQIESSWKRNDSKMVWTVEIPPGATANLRVSGKLVEIIGAPQGLVENAIQNNDYQGKAQLIKLAFGKYKITSRLK